MADEPAAGATPAPGPSYSLIGQYIRDLSFENPGAPASILGNATAPSFSIGINVGVKKQAEEVYAVEITINAKAERDKALLFNVELVYGGVYRIKNVTEQQLAPLLMIECPTMIFPFARQVLATTVQAGGFPPVMMEPVDFRQIYVQNLKAIAAQQAQPTTPAN